MRYPAILMFERDGFQLTCKIEGKGIPVLVIGDTQYYPRTFSSRLREHFQFIFISHRGFAPHGGPEESEDFQLSKILEDIKYIQDRLGLPKVIVVGHSIHALMALAYAQAHPEHVSRLVLIASSPVVGAELHAAANRYLEESVCPERKEALAVNLAALDAALAAAPEQAFIMRLLHFAPMIWYDYHYDARPLWEGVYLNPLGAEVIWGKMFAEVNLHEKGIQVDCPIFLAQGRYDYWNPPYLWESARPYLRNLTVRVFEQSGHTPQLEEAMSFDQEVLRWLKSDARESEK